MKKILSMFLLGCIMTAPFTSCMGDEDDPNTDGFIITSPTSIGEVNSSIGEVKEQYCSSSAPNFYNKIEKDVIIEGVVVANDEGGNLYQTLMLRKIDTTSTGEVSADQSIVLSIKNTCLYPYFPKGQRVKVNLKGLYAGCNSKLPKIGQPYKTSSGNLKLGPMLIELCKTNIELVGTPDTTLAELKPIVLDAGWLSSKSNLNYKNIPMLATVEGTIDEMQNGKDSIPAMGELTNRYEPLPKIFAPEILRDAGFGVSRTLSLSSSKTNVVVRTSTRNSIAFLPLPKDAHSYTGMMSSAFEGGWQIQLRTVEDVFPRINY